MRPRLSWHLADAEAARRVLRPETPPLSDGTGSDAPALPPPARRARTAASGHRHALAPTLLHAQSPCCLRQRLWPERSAPRKYLGCLSRVLQSSGVYTCGAARARGAVSTSCAALAPVVGVAGASWAHSSPVSRTSADLAPVDCADRRTHTAQKSPFSNLLRFSSHMQVPVPAMAEEQRADRALGGQANSKLLGQIAFESSSQYPDCLLKPNKLFSL